MAVFWKNHLKDVDFSENALREVPPGLFQLDVSLRAPPASRLESGPREKIAPPSWGLGASPELPRPKKEKKFKSKEKFQGQNHRRSCKRSLGGRGEAGEGGQSENSFPSTRLCGWGPGACLGSEPPMRSLLACEAQSRGDSLRGASRAHPPHPSQEGTELKLRPVRQTLLQTGAQAGAFPPGPVCPPRCGRPAPVSVPHTHTRRNGGPSRQNRVTFVTRPWHPEPAPEWALRQSARARAPNPTMPAPEDPTGSPARPGAGPPPRAGIPERQQRPPQHARSRGRGPSSLRRLGREGAQARPLWEGAHVTATRGAHLARFMSTPDLCPRGRAHSGSVSPHLTPPSIRLGFGVPSSR